MGFSEPYCPGEAELTFLQRVASEVSIAVDGHLTRRDLAKERDRIRVLFEITNSVISKLPLDERFRAVSRSAVWLCAKASSRSSVGMEIEKEWSVRPP